jgi:CDP-diacylglycerol---glycerol-3-phosphate 3-phosphatidyltransferase
MRRIIASTLPAASSGLRRENRCESRYDPAMPDMRRSIPNLITMVRLMLAAAFFLVVSVPGVPLSRPEVGTLAIVLFIVAALTDVLDGYLARRWKAVSAFGRIMDPFVDKVLVLGAFILLAGEDLAPASGVQAWMVVVIVARELLVTTIRAVLESRGIEFGADWSGKAKMFVQSVTIPFCLLTATHEDLHPGWLHARAALVGAAVVLTAASIVPYVVRATRALRDT